MFKLKGRRVLHLGLAGVLLASMASATPAQAQWHDRSDELPGLTSTKTLLLIGGATLGAVLLLAHVSKSTKDDSTSTGSRTSQALRSGAMPVSSLCNAKRETLVAPPAARSIGFVLDIQEYGVRGVDLRAARLAQRNRTMTLGLSLGL